MSEGKRPADVVKLALAKAPASPFAHDLEQVERIARHMRETGELLDAHVAIRLLRGVGAPAPATTAIAASWAPLPASTLTTPPPARRWLLRHPAEWSGPGDGLLPLGKAGLYTGEGGVSKTNTLIQLAVSVLTGCPWLGHFEVPPEARRGRALLALGEEDHEEVHRRLWDVAEALELDGAARSKVLADLVVLPLAGRPVALLSVSEDRRTIAESAELEALRERLRSDGPWSFVALDPLARWAGADAEASNEIATRLVQAIESLTEVPGNPTVLAAHHSSKMARRTGTVDARGVTAITDGMRWAAELRADGESVYFRQAKSNYSRPMLDELRLVRVGRGLLRVPTATEDREREGRAVAAADDELTDQLHRVVMALRGEPAGVGSIDAVVRLAGMKLSAGRAAVQLALGRGLIVRGGTLRAPVFTAPDVPGARAADPRTPGTSGRPEERTPWTSGTSRDVGGRRDVEASSQNGRAS